MKLSKKKSLGQNFLRDENILKKIVQSAEVDKSDKVLEIGPGDGALTVELLRQAGQIIAVEKDQRLQAPGSPLLKLQQQFLDKNKEESKLKLYFQDILEINLPEILQTNNFMNNGYKVVANIPYYITGKIIRLLFQLKDRPTLIVLLTQKEVAERICATTGKNSIISLAVQYYAQPEITTIVPKEAFEPIPKVDSAILKMVLKKEEDIDKQEEKDFFRLIKIGFSSPRKKLLNNLSAGLQVDKEAIEKIFQQMNIKLNIRAEELSLAEWKKLTTQLVSEFQYLF